MSFTARRPGWVAATGTWVMAERLSPIEAAIARLLRAVWEVEQREREEWRRRMRLVKSDPNG